MYSYDPWTNYSPYCQSAFGRPAQSPLDCLYSQQRPSYYRSPSYSMQYHNPYSCYDSYEDPQFYNDYINSQRIKQQQQLSQNRSRNDRSSAWIESNNDNRYKQSINIPIQRETSQTSSSVRQSKHQQESRPDIQRTDSLRKSLYRDIPIFRTDGSRIGSKKGSHISKAGDQKQESPNLEHHQTRESPNLEHHQTQEAHISDVSPKVQEEKQSELDIFKLIETVQNDANELSCQVDKFNGTARDKQYRYLDEMLTRCLIKLDAIEVNGRDDVRQARKAVVNTINNAVSLLESKICEPNDREENSSQPVSSENQEEAIKNDSNREDSESFEDMKVDSERSENEATNKACETSSVRINTASNEESSLSDLPSNEIANVDSIVDTESHEALDDKIDTDEINKQPDLIDSSQVISKVEEQTNESTVAGDRLTEMRSETGDPNNILTDTDDTKADTKIANEPIEDCNLNHDIQPIHVDSDTTLHDEQMDDHTISFNGKFSDDDNKAFGDVVDDEKMDACNNDSTGS